MGPKVESVCGFVMATGKVGGIGALADALDILRGHKGTLIKS
jgi:carbamate kinase